MLFIYRSEKWGMMIPVAYMAVGSWVPVCVSHYWAIDLCRYLWMPQYASYACDPIEVLSYTHFQ